MGGFFSQGSVRWPARQTARRAGQNQGRRPSSRASWIHATAGQGDKVFGVGAAHHQRRRGNQAVVHGAHDQIVGSRYRGRSASASPLSKRLRLALSSTRVRAKK